jgi:hypothetical protein
VKEYSINIARAEEKQHLSSLFTILTQTFDWQTKSANPGITFQCSLKANQWQQQNNISSLTKLG